MFYDFLQKKTEISIDKYIGRRYIIATIYRNTIYRITIETVLTAESTCRTVRKENTMYESIALTEATYYILLSLYEPQHGYGIMQQAEALSHGRVRLAAGTLYGALNAMVEKRWIVQLPVEDGSRKKNYQITELGLSVLKQELERLRELVNNGDAILGGRNNG